MRKLIFAALALIAIACSQYEEPTLLPDSDVAAAPTLLDSEPAPDSIKVNVFEALRMASSELSPVSATSRSASVTIDSVLSAEGKAVLYILNFGENGGFLITSAVKTAAPVIAFNDRGHFDLANINPNAKFGLDIITHNVENTLTLPLDSTFENRLLWSLVENREAPSISRAAPENGEDFDSWPESLKQQFYNSQAVMKDSISSWNFRNYYMLEGDENALNTYLSNLSSGNLTAREVFDAARESCYWQFQTNYKPISLIRYISYDVINSEALMVKSKWGQRNGYNAVYPSFTSVKNETISPACCVPVAIGQIMRYYEWPQSYDWSAMPFEYATSTTSEFLFSLAQTGKANFGPNETTMTNSNANNTFKAFGYNTSGVKNLENLIDLQGVVTSGKPVFITGSRYDSESQLYIGHAFVAGGFRSTFYRRSILLYTVKSPGKFEIAATWLLRDEYSCTIYINWGYAGSGDGYYSSNYLDVNGKVYNHDMHYILATPNK